MVSSHHVQSGFEVYFGVYFGAYPAAYLWQMPVLQ